VGFKLYIPSFKKRRRNHKNRPILQYLYSYYVALVTTQQKTLSRVLFLFHTLLLIRNKHNDVFYAASVTLSAHTLAQNYLEPRANLSRV